MQFYVQTVRAGLGLIALLVFGGGCGQAKLEQLEENQTKILAELAKMQKGAGRAPAPQPRRGPDPAKTYAVPVGASAYKGAADAWVTIVEVSDFQCPYCSRVTPTLGKIAAQYGDDIRLVFKHNALPFHKRAKPAARAAECAGEQGKFWPMHDQLFANQKQLEDSDLEGYASSVGVELGSWKDCYQSGKYDAKIDADQRLAGSLGARGTPAFFINGRYLSGAQPLERFTALIDAELAKAKQSGVPRRDYYAQQVVAKGLERL